MKNSKSVKFIILLILGALCVLTASITYRHFIDDLRSSNITEEISYHPEWDIPPLTRTEKKKINSILQQTFTFVGEGGQSYVFASSDQQYVLKLFKFNRFRPAWGVNWLPDALFKSYKAEHSTKREQKLFTAFNGHRLAFEKIREESGLIHIQLKSLPYLPNRHPCRSNWTIPPSRFRTNSFHPTRKGGNP